MAWPSAALLWLLLLFAGQVNAGPETDMQPAGVQSSVCRGHDALHHRLDAVEKRMEDTVQKMEAEMALLLDAIQTHEWQPILDPDSPTIDILDEPDKSTVP